MPPVPDRDAGTPTATQFTQQRGRVKDVPARALGPLSVNEPGELDAVELAETCCVGVHDVNTAFAGVRCKCPVLDPSADCRNQRLEVCWRRIKPCICVTQTDQHVQDGCAASKKPLSQWIVRCRQALMFAQKPEQALQIVSARPQ